MVIVDYLSRSNRKINLLHLDFNDESSKDRVSFLKSMAKHLKLDLEIVKGSKTTSEITRLKELYTLCSTKSPSYVLMANCLDDVVVSYIYNSLRLNPKLMSYRSKNIIRPFINTTQEDLDYWATSKKVGYLEKEVVDRSSNWLIRRHMLDNCYKINPDLKEQLLVEVNREFESFIKNRTKSGKK